ncbi:glycosyltransferase family 4 protein [Escherichia albertii]|nr:glycosyltransferase family 4 protein [Escherichia albertii]MCZ9036182.1 glycosyltransferase family 4 protein [Escherichia albertii]
MNNILIFSHEYPPSLGGAGTVAELLVENFSQDVSNNVEVLTSVRSINLKSDRVHIVHLSRKFWFLAYLPWLFFYAKKYDHIIINDPAAIYSSGVILPKSILRRATCIIHGVEKYLTSKNKIIKFIGFSHFFKRSLNNCRNVVFVSDFIKNKYKELYGIEVKNSVVIHSGIKISRTEKFNYSSKIDNKNGIIKFLTVSRLVEGKGYDRMLSIFQLLNQMGLNFEWHIVGDGYYKQKFEEKLKQSSIYDKVTLVGAVDRKELPKIYSSYDFYILLSDLEESFGLSYLEAASAGIIPIGYNRYGVKEAFKYIKYGFLLNAKYGDKELAEKIFYITKSDFSACNECFRNEKDFYYAFKSLIN